MRGRETLALCGVCGREIVWLRDAPNPICTDCHRLRTMNRDLEERAAKRLARAGLTEGEPARMRFGTFQRSTKTQIRAYDCVVQWLADWTAQMQLAPSTGFADSVLLWSKSPGVGKTHLARSAQRSVILHGDLALFRTMPDLIDQIQGSYDDAEASTHRIIAKVRGAELLILDDVGAGYVSQKARPWLEGLLYKIIEHRHTRSLPLLVTSNLDPKALCDLMGPRTSSRFNQMVRGRVCDMTGPDWRMR